MPVGEKFGWGGARGDPRWEGFESGEYDSGEGCGGRVCTPNLVVRPLGVVSQD